MGIFSQRHVVIILLWTTCWQIMTMTSAESISNGRSYTTTIVRRVSSTTTERKSSRMRAEETHRRIDPSTADLQGRRVVCLYNNAMYYSTEFAPIFIEADNCTHLNYEFAILDPKTYELVPGEPQLDIQQGFYDQAVQLKIFNPKLKVMLSMGGWRDSTRKYSELMERDSRIDNFVDKVIPFLKQHGFDGLDVAWEFPNGWQGAIGISPKDKPNFAKFLKKVREKFDKNELLLSISATAVKREIHEGYDGPAISDAVHFVNVMTYDMHGPWEATTGHHSPLGTKTQDEDQFMNMKAAMEEWAKIGVDRLKLNAGIPTYAKTFTLENPDNHDIGSVAIGPGKKTTASNTPGFMCYYEICQLLNNGNWSESEDREHGFYAWSGDQWACYDPPSMVVRKVKWLMESGFGGVLLKDASCDDFQGLCSPTTNPLVKMAKMEMIHKLYH